MSQEERSDIILGPGRPSGGLFGRSFTVGPYQVGILIIDGELQPPFTEGTRGLPRGRQVETYVASTGPFNLVFWLDDPSDPASPAQGVLLDQPVLTADGQPVTGRIELSFSVIPEYAARLLRLRRMGAAEIRAGDVSNAIKGELVAKVLALELFRFTSDELRGNRRPLQDIYGSTQTELASTFSGYGLRLDNFNVSWGLTNQEREKIKEDRHRSAVRDVEREGELEQARWRGEPARDAEPSEQEPPFQSVPTGPTGNGEGPGDQVGAAQGSGAFWWQLAVGVLVIAGFAGVLLFFTLAPNSDSQEDSSVVSQPREPDSTPVSAFTTAPTPLPTAAATRVTAVIPTSRMSERTRGDLSCFEPGCSQRSDPLEDSFDNFLVEATFLNPTMTDGFEYGFTIEGAFQDGIAEDIEIRVADDRTWRAYIQKSVHETMPVSVDQWQREIGGGEIPEPFIRTGAGDSNKLEASIFGDEGCLYVNGILVSCFDISGRSLAREIKVSSEIGDVRYTGFRAREAQAGG